MSELPFDPLSEQLSPLAAAMMRAVLLCATLEKLLLLDLAQRRASEIGLGQELSNEIAGLERKSAGTLATRLRRAGIDPDVASRVDDLVTG